MTSNTPNILHSPQVPAGGEVDILGVRITDRDLEDATNFVIESSRDKKPIQFAFVNPDCLNIACKHAEYKKTLQKEVPEVWGDGVGLQIASKMLGRKLRDNVNGTDMFPLLCEKAAAEGVSIYLLGARPGIAEAVAENMQKRFPELKIAGARDGYWKPEEEKDVMRQVRESDADVLLVAMGAPKQDMWIAENLQELGVPVAIGVGGLFDFFSGRIKRAPMLWRKIGLEWCWRML